MKKTISVDESKNPIRPRTSAQAIPIPQDAGDQKENSGLMQRGTPPAVSNLLWYPILGAMSFRLQQLPQGLLQCREQLESLEQRIKKQDLAIAELNRQNESLVARLCNQESQLMRFQEKQARPCKAVWRPVHEELVMYFRCKKEKDKRNALLAEKKKTFLDLAKGKLEELKDRVKNHIDELSGELGSDQEFDLLNALGAAIMNENLEDIESVLKEIEEMEGMQQEMDRDFVFDF